MASDKVALQYVRWKSGVTFVRRCFHDGHLIRVHTVCQCLQKGFLSERVNNDVNLK